MFQIVDENDPLVKTERLASRLMKEHGLTDKGWTFEFAKDKRTVGWCHTEDKVIAVSLYFIHNHVDEIEDTVRHEIAHALSPPVWNERKKRWDRHGPRWKAMAITLGAKPKSCADRGVTSSARFNYLIKCSECGKVVGRKHRLRREYMNRYRSNCCKAKLTAYHIIYKQGGE